MLYLNRDSKTNRSDAEHSPQWIVTLYCQSTFAGCDHQAIPLPRTWPKLFPTEYAQYAVVTFTVLDPLCLEIP